MKEEKLIHLPYSTDSTIKGPIVKNQGIGTSLIVDYDHEQNDGTINITRLEFKEALAFEYRQSVCCGADRIVSFHDIVCYNKSRWLNEIIKFWNKSVGWQEWQKQRGSADRFSHYRIFFDDSACIDIISSSVFIKGNIHKDESLIE